MKSTLMDTTGKNKYQRYIFKKIAVFWHPFIFEMEVYKPVIVSLHGRLMCKRLTRL